MKRLPLCRYLKARQLSTAQEAVKDFKPGDRLHGYTVQKIDEIPELFLTAVSLSHDKTGAQHLHIARDDDNNTFSVAFRTTPMDNTGVPHILEHTTLCGSQKFPVRDPFMKMLNRSLATFMNAMTASDWTTYPFSTQNRRDFNNLLSVYLDAVFHPQLRELDFRQEGWRLEHENLNDKNSALKFKGVVYNEMKGVFSSQHNIFIDSAQRHLLPSHTYGVCSGGDPAYIPDLTWDHLKNFHKTHYHPSNSKFFTYGNFPLEEHLEYINSNYLQQFDKIDPNTSVPLEKRWDSPREASITCQPDTMAPDPEKQTTVAVSFLLSDITDISEAATLSIISTLLTDGENSPFYQALLGANIGSDYSPVIGYNGYTKEATFSVGLQGIHKNDVEKVKQIISDTIDKVIKNGFEQSRIDALLHRIELSQKHQTSNFGLHLGLSVASGWTHDGDPAEMLKVNKQVTLFKQRLADDPQYLQKKVKQYWKDNNHKLVLSMSPDEKYLEKQQKTEEEKLQSCIGQLNEDEKARIYQLGLELQEKQNTKDDPSILPTLHLHEIDRQIKKEKVTLTTIDDIPAQYSEQPTNEVAYIKMMSFLDAVPEEMKLYVPLFTDVITKMGAGVMDYMELSHEIELHTGGLNASTHVCTDPLDLYGFDQGVVFSSHCLERNLDEMLELWTEIFDRVSFRDTERLTTLIRMSAAEQAAMLSHSGHSYAMSHSASSLTPAAKQNEVFGGVTQVSVMKRIAESEDQTRIMEHLKEIGLEVLNKNNLKICVNATPQFMPTALKGVETFLESLKSNRKPMTKVKTDHTTHSGKLFHPSSMKTQIELPFSVNYMSKSIQGVPYTHEDYSTLQVLSRLLYWKYLHTEIREKGGAYGGGAMCQPGVFSFFSYRDPNSMETLSVFDKSVEWATRGDFTDVDIDEAKLSVFQKTDQPVPPGSVGSTQFLSNVTNEMRQESRDRLFSVTKQQLLDVTNRYLVGSERPQSSSFLGPANSFVADSSEWKVIKE